MDRKFVSFMLVLFGGLVFSAVAWGTTFTVDSTVDTVDASLGDGSCSDAIGRCTLRAAIMELNAVGGSGHAINLSSGTYQLAISGDEEDSSAKGDLDIKCGLAIRGVTAGETIIDGGDKGRIFHIMESPAGADVEVSIIDVTLQNGEDREVGGGAIYVEDGQSLYISASIVMANSTVGGGSEGGGAIYNAGMLEVNASYIHDNSAATAGMHGGGILSLGANASAIISNSTISDNLAGGNGGGIENDGVMRIYNSTIAGNTAGGSGGGIDARYTNGGSMRIASSTIANNMTESGNVAGINSDGGRATIMNTIVAGNQNSDGDQIDCSGLVASNDYNIFGAAEFCSFTGGANDLRGTAGSPVDARLDSLAPNGGLAFTIAPRPGSPAVDGGDPAGCYDGNGVELATDQRGDGFPRIITRCDIGAVEIECGNGQIEGWECDDGGANSDTEADACRTTCVAASCGDSVTDAGEGCDDGNTNNIDACNNSCVSTTCGDGVVQSATETCDSGVAGNSDTVANACRTTCIVAYCGDGVIDTGEECDGGTGCTSSCLTATSSDGEMGAAGTAGTNGTSGDGDEGASGGTQGDSSTGGGTGFALAPGSCSLVVTGSDNRWAQHASPLLWFFVIYLLSRHRQTARHR